MTKQKVVVGMSGGVDSSVTAYLLQKQGYEVLGVTMRMWQEQATEQDQAVQDAKKVAAQLGISHTVLDFQNQFREQVVSYFIESYEKGLTPNPCIMCNRHIKWEALLEYAAQVGADVIATGHYANIQKHPQTGRYTICVADAKEKDQTYALYRLTQEQLQKTLMPLGAYEKAYVREIAQNIGDFIAKKGDSQDICFIPDGDYAAFLDRMCGKSEKTGAFVDLEGNPLGEHKGLRYYTVGQRKGLGIAFGKPMYVYGLDAQQNEVVLCENDQLFSHTVYAHNINCMSVPAFSEGMRLHAKIRYSHKMAPCSVRMVAEDILECTFDAPQRAVTPGQALVLYDGAYLAGGGEILGTKLPE